MADLVKEYYWVLRRALRAHPRLRRCLTRCRHCRIFFLTDPRNAGRRDLRCPFGCRDTHRKRESTHRSVAYYRGEEGKKRRRQQNGNRQFTGMAPVPHPPSAPSAPSPPPPSLPSPPPVSSTAASPGGWPLFLVEYVRMLVSLIEGRRVSRPEILEMLARVLRQHSMAQRRPLDHIIARLHEHPP